MRVVTLFTHSGHLMASVYTCIIDIYVEILTASVARMRVVTLYIHTKTHLHVWNAEL